MKQTAVGTTLGSLSVGQANASNGWVFSFAGGRDDSLFSIEGSLVKVAAPYVKPGKKLIKIRADFPPDPVNWPPRITNDVIPVMDRGTIITAANYISIPANVIPSFSSDYILRFSMFIDTAANINILSNGTKVPVSIDTTGVVTIRDDLGNTPLATSAAGSVTVGNWVEVKIVKMGTNTTITIDGVPTFVGASFAGMPDVTQAIKLIQTTGQVVIVNLYVEVNGVIFVKEELNDSQGALTMTGTCSFQTQRSDP